MTKKDNTKTEQQKKEEWQKKRPEDTERVRKMIELMRRMRGAR